MSADHVDVLIAGFGLAGASAALAAHAAGATVLVAEKTPAGGGNCRHSGGFLFSVDGPGAIDHLDALCFGKTDRAVLEAYAAGAATVVDWVTELGGAAPICDPAAFGGLLPSWPHFPGAGHVTYRQFAGRGGPPGIALWEMAESAVRAREIEVVTDTAVAQLMMDGDRVVGAELESDGQTREVRAESVVLTSGGIEYDEDLRDGSLPLPLTPVGHPGNTGDTVRLAQQAGASLWHMAAYFGWLACARPGFPAAFTINVHAPSHVFVDGDGLRFADEMGWEVHDQMRSWTTFQPRRHNRPRAHGFVIFDEAARLAGPLHGIVGTPNDYHWSPDNSAEVQAGWITRAATPAELARAIDVDPEALTATLEQYAVAVAVGRDDLLHRPPQTLVPLRGPLYALPVVPGLATASGGPRRDARARVLRRDGQPVDGLYAAGAAGSIWGHLTEHGGGLTDAIVFGQIAGAGAAARAVVG